MKRTILLFLLCAVGGAIADTASTNAVAVSVAPTNIALAVSTPTNFVTKPVRNPFWPIGYTGEWTRISSEVRPKPKPKPPAPKPKVETKKKVEIEAQIAAQKAAKEAAEKAAAAERAAKEAAAQAKAAAEKAAAEKAAAEAAKPREITPEDWRKAQRALKGGSPVTVKAEDGTVRSAININGNIYVDGDLMSFTHDGIRFTWRIQGLDGKEKKVKLVRVKARLVEQPKKIEQPKKPGGGK